MVAGVQVKQQLRKMKEKAISRGKWQGSGGPKGADSIKLISELGDWEVHTTQIASSLQCLHLHTVHHASSTLACQFHEDHGRQHVRMKLGV